MSIFLGYSGRKEGEGFGIIEELLNAVLR